MKVDGTETILDMVGSESRDKRFTEQYTPMYIEKYDSNLMKETHI